MSEVLSAAARPVADRSDQNGRGFRPDVQGLRALAVSMVVIYHLYPSLVPGGFAGVDVFFVISGFLITRHLWRGYQRDGRVRLLDFWGRRARRLVPAAALVLGVTWVVARLVLPPGRLADTAGQIRASALYFQNWQLAHEAVDYLTSNAAATPVQHFWSLSVEEQFYLVWPLLFVFAALAGRRHRCVVLAGFVVTLVAASLVYSVYETRVDRAAAYFLTTTRMWELGAGGVLAMLPERVDRHRPAAQAIPPDPPTVRAARLMAGKVKVIDMNQFICGHGVCPSVVGNVLVYFDAHHMTSSYVATTRRISLRGYSAAAPCWPAIGS